LVNYKLYKNYISTAHHF